MTRQPHPRRGGAYVDRGHYARKAIWWATLTVFLLLLAIPYAVVTVLADGLGYVVEWMLRVKHWAHPCLHEPLPRVKEPSDA